MPLVARRINPAPWIEFPAGERMPGTDWVMRRVIGQGGMGVVLEVGKGRNLRAAMKVLRPALARSAEFETKFAGEVEVMARMRHPNIVQVWDCGALADGSPFFLMELLTGRTIRAAVAAHDMRPSAETVWRIVGQICAGLSYAHSDRPAVVHCDIKPENVFLHCGRHIDAGVKLLDFGIAKLVGLARSAEQVVGTLRYMAPEALRQEPLTAKVDLYALAVLVYELLTQGCPWPVSVRSRRAVSEAHLKLEPLAPSHWKRWIPKSVDDCLLQALSKDPALRQRDVTEFHEQLADLQVVDDGSPRYRGDATTVPTVETMARGRSASGNAFPEADSPVPASGGWLDDARSRLADPSGSFDATGVTVPSTRAIPNAAAQDNAKANDRPDLPAQGASQAEGDAPTSAHTPRPSAALKAIRARWMPAVLLVAAGAVAIAGPIGWMEWRSLRSGTRPTSSVLDRADAERTVVQDRGAASAGPQAAPDAETDVADANGGSTTDAGTASIWANAAHARPAAPLRRRTGGPAASSSSNLDDVLFHPDDAMDQARPESNANRADGSGAARPSPRPQ